MTQKPPRLGHFVLSRIGLSLLLIVFILLIPAACSGDEKSPSVRSEARLYAGPLNANLADFVEKLDRKVPPLLDGYGTPGASIALVNNGELAWARGYGWADAAKKRPVTPETVFGVASVSKPFAAWGVMRLAEQGRLDLDAPIGQYLTRWHLPPSKFDSRLVTARRLLSHTAGISWRPQCDKEPRSLEEALLDECKDGAPAIIERAPGEFSYSGHGYTMLQLAIEEITHESFADYMKREVLAPLGLDGAGYRPADFSQPLGLGYCQSEAKPEVRPLPLAGQVLQALGGLDATAPAVGQFVAAAMAGPSGAQPGRDVLSPQTIGTMLTSAPGTEGASLFDGTDSFGLGYGLKTGGGDARMVLHSGGNACWSAIFAFFPTLGQGIVILTNSGDSSLQQQVVCDWQAWAVPASADGGCPGLYDIYAMKSDGTDSRRIIGNLGSDLMPRWAPNGQRIAFHRGPRWWSLYTAKDDGSGEKRLTESRGIDSYAAWSPDGSRLAFVSTRDGNEEIYVMNADGSKQQRLTKGAANDSFPAWSPDGKRIAFLRGDQGASVESAQSLWVMSVDGTGQRVLTSEAASQGIIGWSPEGGSIAFVRNDDIYLIGINGADLRRLTEDGGGNRDPAWAPDGKRIAFSAGRPGHHDIYVMNGDGSGRVRLTEGAADDLMPAWSPDGQRIAFASNRRVDD